MSRQVSGEHPGRGKGPRGLEGVQAGGNRTLKPNQQPLHIINLGGKLSLSHCDKEKPRPAHREDKDHCGDATENTGGDDRDVGARVSLPKWVNVPAMTARLPTP